MKLPQTGLNQAQKTLATARVGAGSRAAGVCVRGHCKVNQMGSEDW